MGEEANSAVVKEKPEPEEQRILIGSKCSLRSPCTEASVSNGASRLKRTETISYSVSFTSTCRQTKTGGRRVLTCSCSLQRTRTGSTKRNGGPSAETF